ncbi:hypothetical protein FKP32DRAFT_1421820 [Trametes sanguinea]|nr:hypothetical protein FKP32DRAFT_1421820 [Trametes sanguinea]
MPPQPGRFERHCITQRSARDKHMLDYPMLILYLKLNRSLRTCIALTSGNSVPANVGRMSVQLLLKSRSPRTRTRATSFVLEYESTRKIASPRPSLVLPREHTHITDCLRQPAYRNDATQFCCRSLTRRSTRAVRRVRVSAATPSTTTGRTRTAGGEGAPTAFVHCRGGGSLQSSNRHGGSFCED